MMPRLSVYFIRASLIYLLLGFTFGALILANKGLIIVPSIWILLPIHIEFDLIGWLVQLAMGVAFWILPRFSKAPIRGNERLGWSAFILINAGILFVVADGLLETNGLMLIGRVFEALALVLFAVGNWRRIKAHGVG
jgi:hypothetical protein